MTSKQVILLVSAAMALVAYEAGLLLPVLRCGEYVCMVGIAFAW